MRWCRHSVLRASAVGFGLKGLGLMATDATSTRSMLFESRRHLGTTSCSGTPSAAARQKVQGKNKTTIAQVTSAAASDAAAAAAQASPSGKDDCNSSVAAAATGKGTVPQRTTTRRSRRPALRRMQEGKDGIANSSSSPSKIGVRSRDALSRSTKMSEAENTRYEMAMRALTEETFRTSSPLSTALQTSSTATSDHTTSRLASLSNAQLKDHISVSNIVARIQETVATCTRTFAAWSQLPSDRTLRQLERQLELAIQQRSFDTYSALHEDMKQRYESPVKADPDNVSFLMLYVRVLANYGTFCLLNFETQRAVHLLEEALHLAKRSSAITASLRQHGDEEGAEVGDASDDANAWEAEVIYLRIILANALSCERLYWRAAQQYQQCQHVVRMHPCMTLDQIVPGPAGVAPFEHELLQEDADQFFKDKRRLRQAISQGRAQLLLLQSQGADAESRRAAQLALARLHHSAGQFTASQKLYESYLDSLVEANVEDTHGVMLELGRMLSFEANKSSAGLVYVESAVEVLCEDAETFAAEKEASGSSLSPTASCTVIRAASALLDCGLIYERAQDTGKAVGMMESAIALLRRCDLIEIGAWAMMKYADILSSLTLVDKALELYMEGMNLIDNKADDDEVLVQLGQGQSFLVLSAAEVEAHMAYCLQTYVGDYRRAVRHYDNVLSTFGVLRGTSSSTADVAPDTLHWVFTNYVNCCERLRDWEGAIEVQNRLIEMESLAGADLVPSYIRLITLLDRMGDIEKQLALYFYLFFLPDRLLEESIRVDISHGFAKCCYLLGNQRMGAVLMNAVQKVRGDRDPVALVDYALCLKSLPDGDRATLKHEEQHHNISTDVSSIAKVFRRAAQLIIANRVVEAADRSRGEGEDPASQKKVQKRLVDDELMSLIALSRGAFFFHQNGFSKEAADLYSTALALADQTVVQGGSDAYNRELGILLANYATLQATEDPAAAEEMYERAARICPEYLEVLEVVADYYLQSSNYAKGAAHMKRVMSRNPDSAVDMHCRLARLGCGSAWEQLDAAGRLEAVEHMVLGLGISATRIPCYGEEEPTTKANISARLAALEPLLLDGVATTSNDEYACLGCYFVQTKFSNNKFLNELYRKAISRFPCHTAMLVNYAKFCADMGYHSLTRKYYAKAYAISEGDFCRTQCYANYLSSHYAHSQAGTGELLYRAYLDSNPESSQANIFYANYVGVMLPTPVKTEHYFEKGFKLDPRTKHLGLYANFVWACADNPASFGNNVVRSQIFDKAEHLFRLAAEIEPTNADAHHQLGIFYANRTNRFDLTIESLHKAHQLSPSNAEVVRQLCSALFEECNRVHREEMSRHQGAAKQGVEPLHMSPRLRSLIESAKVCFEKAVQMDASHRALLEQYARFAVTCMKDPKLAAELWQRIHRLGTE